MGIYASAVFGLYLGINHILLTLVLFYGLFAEKTGITRKKYFNEISHVTVSDPEFLLLIYF